MNEAKTSCDVCGLSMFALPPTPIIRMLMESDIMATLVGISHYARV